jgi:hypothetical protein
MQVCLNMDCEKVMNDFDLLYRECSNVNIY